MMIGRANESKAGSTLQKIGFEMAQLHEYFRCFDVDSTETQPDFTITITEFSKVMRCLGHSYSNELLETVFNEVMQLPAVLLLTCWIRLIMTGPESLVSQSLLIC